MSRFPWQATPELSANQQVIADPVSGASITLPCIGGLTVNEVLFAQWLQQQDYEFLRGNLDSQPENVKALVSFCHQFLCLRLGLADWVEDALLFEDEPLTAAQSLTMALPSGESKAAPLYCLYMVYGFFIEEQAAWLGKPQSRMMQTIAAVLSPPSIGPKPTGNFSENTQATPDSQAKHSDDAQPTSSNPPSKRRSKPASTASETEAA